MNAPAKQKTLAPQSAYQMLPVEDISPSSTHIQQLRRSRFDPASMAELVKSVAEHGVLQPIIVRPNPIEESERIDGELAFEIVAGERRWLAAHTAKLAHLPAIVRELTDLQVIEIQLVENLQREGLHPLEEAEGFADLMQLKGVNAEAIAETIGRSRSHVFARLKLLDLIPDARAAFSAGRIDTSKAQLIARIPLPKLQVKALKHAQELDWQQQPISFRDFKRWLDNNKFTVELKGACFSLGDAALHTPAGSCTACPKRTGNLGDLFADVKNPDVCTDPECFTKKTALYEKRLRSDAEAAGRTIVSAEAAKTMILVPLDSESDEEFGEPEPQIDDDDNGLKTPEYIAWEERADAFTPRTYRQILGDTAAAAAVLVEKGKTLIEALPLPVAKKLLKPHGVALPSWFDRDPEPAADPAARRAAEEKQRERQEREIAYRRGLLAQIHAKWKPPLKHDDLLDIVGRLLQITSTRALDAVCYNGKTPEPEKMNDAELMRLAVLLTVCRIAEDPWNHPGPLIALAKRCKIDPAAVKKGDAAKTKAKAKPAAAKKKVVKPAKKKAAKK